MKSSLIAIALFFCSVYCHAQAQKEAASQKDDYLQVINKRSEKIVTTLGIADSNTFFKVRDLIATQYINLNNLQKEQEKSIEVIQQKAGIDKVQHDKEAKVVADETMRRSDSLHKIYLASLARELSDQQIEKVKDGMTFGVLPITYKGYQEMLPELTAEQKAQILAYLTEAREKAMDAGSAEDKHKWFGKYKGKINNYLSAQGYDMKKAGEEWQARIKAGKSK